MAVGVGAVAALGALGAAVGGDVVLVGVGAALSMDAHIVESQREVGRSTQEREAGYGKPHAASPRRHT